MSNLDKEIATVSHILDSLIALRNILKTGSCNECAVRKGCGYQPKLGELVRYNCPFYVGKNKARKDDKS